MIECFSNYRFWCISHKSRQTHPTSLGYSSQVMLCSFYFRKWPLVCILLSVLNRNKRSIAVSLKHSSGVDVVKQLCSQADVLIEPYRPGIMEKLGLGPDTLLKKTPSLIYARLTGFGQTGPLSHRAGHDINYLATSGLLSVRHCSI